MAKKDRITGKAWEREYDARLKDPKVHKDVMKNGGIFKPTETRVADDTGTMRRRNGDGCCGCGRWNNHHGEEIDTGRPVVDHPHSHDEDEGPKEKFFLGLF